jgi:flagellar FliL protein
MAKGKDDEAADGDAKKGGMGGKLKLIALILPTLLLIGGGVYFFVLAPKAETSASQSEGEESSEAEATPKSTYVPGEAVSVDAVTINLANAHILQVGLMLQATADAGEEVPPGKAADALIKVFSGRTVDEIATEEGREEAKKELLKEIKELYEDKVYEIFYTTYVFK